MSSRALLHARRVHRSLAGLAVGLVFALAAGCGGGQESSAERTQGNEGSQSPATGQTAEGTAVSDQLPFKIGIMTGTVSQGEDEYRGAEAVIARYGDRIRHVTYPDNFMTEQEAMISQVVTLASDREVQAIIIAQGVPGSMAAMKRVKEQRPNMKFLLYSPHEDPHQVSAYADVCIVADELERGRTIVDLAHEMGAKTFVHYSFPRHMSQELLARRRDIMANHCAELGMEFKFMNAPDPTGDQGLPGAQKFILEDIPRQVAQSGKDTAFFATNCGMQEPLIRASLEQKAIMPEQCCPSPTHGYPGALGIAISAEDAGDMAKIREQIHAKVVEGGNTGRMAAWPVSVGMVAIEALTEVAIESLRADRAPSDQGLLVAQLQKASGVDVTVVPFEGKDNYFMFLIDSVIF